MSLFSPVQTIPGAAGKPPVDISAAELLNLFRKEGREEGRIEGSLAGKIQLLQQLNGVEELSLETLLQLGDNELSKMLAELQERLRSRGE